MFLFIFFAAFLGTGNAACRDGTIYANGLTCSQKQLIVDLHNQLRNKVAGGQVEGQPRAANMIEMRWNEQVANKSQQWSDGCEFKHDPNLNLNGQPLGQNLALAWGSTDRYRDPDLKGLINSWFNEVYEHGYNGQYSPNSGHYSQMIWGNSRFIGCGITYYRKMAQYYRYLVCNYSPPGNYIGQKPYAYGSRNCKAYMLFDSKMYSDLCAINDTPNKVC